MRGHQLLKTKGQLGLIRKVKRDFADTKLEQITPKASRFFFGAGVESAELITRQYLLSRNTGIPLHKVLLYSIGSGDSRVVYPLPKEFRQILINNGFAISHWRSSIAWTMRVWSLWCFGILSILQHLYTGVRNILSKTAVLDDRYVYFTGMKENSLPRPDKNGKSYDTITWYTQWKGAAAVQLLCHDVAGVKSTFVDGMRVEYRERPFPAINRITDLVSFFFWSVGAAFLSAVDIFRGRWWNAFLLTETSKAAVARFAKPGQLAVDYLFENSDTVYRPIWTYEAESKGSRIVSYFYSTFEDFKLPDNYPPNSTYWQAMNWPLYLVWDDYQEQMVKRNVGETANTQITGPIWLNSSPENLPVFPENSVAVFDVQAFRSSFHFGFSTIVELDYSNPAVIIKFIRDIELVLSAYSGTIIHKRKRKKADIHLHKGYTRVFADLSRENKLISIDPDTSPIQIIEKCAAVISMPFTSTAILGRELGKPSVYYDPIGGNTKR